MLSGVVTIRLRNKPVMPGSMRSMVLEELEQDFTALEKEFELDLSAWRGAGALTNEEIPTSGQGSQPRGRGDFFPIKCPRLRVLT